MFVRWNVLCTLQIVSFCVSWKTFIWEKDHVSLLSSTSFRGSFLSAVSSYDNTIPLCYYSSKHPLKGKVVSLERLVDPSSESGEVSHIVIQRNNDFQESSPQGNKLTSFSEFLEGQSYGVLPIGKTVCGFWNFLFHFFLFC
jgi:hypothetical protein